MAARCRTCARTLCISCVGRPTPLVGTRSSCAGERTPSTRNGACRIGAGGLRRCRIGRSEGASRMRRGAWVRWTTCLPTVLPQGNTNDIVRAMWAFGAQTTSTRHGWKNAWRVRLRPRGPACGDSRSERAKRARSRMRDRAGARARGRVRDCAGARVRAIADAGATIAPVHGNCG